MLTLIKHALRMRRAQSVATFLSVALSVAVTFALVLSSIGVQNGLAVSQERLGADLMVIPADAAADLDQSALLFAGVSANRYMDKSVEAQVAAISGVRRTTAQFYGQTLDAGCCSVGGSARLIGYDAATDWVIAPWTDRGVGGALGAAQVVVGSDLAGDYANGGKVLGHNVDLVATLDATGTDLDDSILMDIDQVRSFVKDTADLSYLWDEYGSPDNLISCVFVEVDDGCRDAVVAKLASMDGITVVEASGTVEKVADQMGTLFSIMAGAAVLLVVAMLFQLFARFFSLAWDRRGELALYRALGASRCEVSLLIGGEAIALVGGGVVTGLALGTVLYLAVPGLLANAGSFPYLTPGLGVCAVVAALVAAVFMTIGLAAVAWPLVQAGRIDPSCAMRTGDIG